MGAVFLDLTTVICLEQKTGTNALSSLLSPIPRWHTQIHTSPLVHKTSMTDPDTHPERLVTESLRIQPKLNEEVPLKSHPHPNTSLGLDDFACQSRVQKVLQTLDS